MVVHSSGTGNLVKYTSEPKLIKPLSGLMLCDCVRKIKAHDKVCIDAKWHPIEPSRVATASWDGTIKYWD